MLINESTLGAIHVDFDMRFNEGRQLAAPMWQEVATEVPSSTKTNTYNWLGAFPGIREWIGDRHVNKLKAHTYSLTNRKYEGTVEVEVDDIEDDQIGIYAPLFTAYGQAVEVYPDSLIAALVAAAISTVCYDSQFYLDTDHPVGSSTVSNYNTGAEDLWLLLDLSRSIKPFILQMRKRFQLTQLNQANDTNVFWEDKIVFGTKGRMEVGYGFWQQAFGSKEALSSTTYNANFAAMMAFTDDESRNLGMKATHLLHGPSNRAKALDILTAERLANGQTNVNRGTAIPLLVNWM